MPGRSSNLGNPNDLNKFTGHERDNEGGLMIDYMLERNYNPVIGRFMSVDPLAAKYHSTSPYSYVLNNPLLFIDPTGLDTVYYDRDGNERSRIESDDHVAFVRNVDNSGDNRLNGDGRHWENYIAGVSSGSITFNAELSNRMFKITSKVALWVGNFAIEGGNTLRISSTTRAGQSDPGSHVNDPSRALDIAAVNGVNVKYMTEFQVTYNLIQLKNYAPKNASQIIGPNFFYNFKKRTSGTLRGMGMYSGKYYELKKFSTSKSKLRFVYDKHGDHFHIGTK